MPKRKRDAAKKKEEEWISCGLPSEIWDQIVSGLDFSSLVKCASLGPADHWLCFFVKHALKQKQLLGICRVLRTVSVPRWMDPGSKMEYPVPATNLLKCFSEGCSPKVLPHVIRDVLESCVYLFMVNKRRTIKDGFAIWGLNYHPMKEPRWRRFSGTKFLFLVQIMLPDKITFDNQNHEDDDADVRKFSSKDYTICIYQGKDGDDDDFHPMGEFLFSFFEKFKFKVELYQARTGNVWPVESVMVRSSPIKIK